MVQVTFLDGTTKEVAQNTSVADVILHNIGEGLFRAAVAAKINDELVDLSTPITTDCTLTVVTFTDNEGKQVFWHSSAHILAIAVKRLFPNAQLTIGPPIDEGFYYDFAVEKPFSDEDLEKIEIEMKKIIKEKIPLQREELSYEQATKLFADNTFKLEIIEEYKDDGLTLYRNGEFFDLCKGPHVLDTGRIKAIHLTKYSGAYWRGDAKKEQLQRIYGISFPSKDDLKAYKKRMEEAKLRDHNKIGRELKLFYTNELVGRGLPLIGPNGAIIIKQLQRWIEDEEELRGYVQTMTPLMGKSDVYKLSGHWDHYKDGMFLVDGCGEEMALRPMTDPFQFLIYTADKHSYKDLPIRYAETSKLFRNESSGEMHGLIRVRQFTISEGHIICRMDQLEEEFTKTVELITYVLNTLGLTEYSYRLSKWDPNNKEKYIDNPKAWEDSQNRLRSIMQKLNMNFTEADGEAAFYGPKLDIQMKNVFGKEDTIITVQVDFALPQRYGMVYTNREGKDEYPIIIHRTSVGCYERTLALLIEKYAGKFPLWLSPKQVQILPISDSHVEYAKMLSQEFLKKRIRASVDERPLTISKKVREAQIKHVNYILVVGDSEVENKTVNVRTRDNVVHGEMAIEDLLNKIIEEIRQFK